jgi:hypothetical protein
LNQAKLEEVLALAGYHYPLTGTLQLNFHLSGSQGDPQGDGNLEIRDATVYGEPVSSVRSNLRLRGKWLECYDLVLQYLHSHVDGTLAYNFDSRQFRSRLTGKEFELGELPRLRDSRFPVDGRVSFTASGSGTPEEPEIEAQIDLEDLILNARIGYDRERNFTNGTRHPAGGRQYPFARGLAGKSPFSIHSARHRSPAAELPAWQHYRTLIRSGFV